MKKVGTGTVTVLPTVGVKVTLNKDKYLIFVGTSLKACAEKLGMEGVSDSVTIEDISEFQKVTVPHTEATLATPSEMVNLCKKDADNKFLGFYLANET